MTQTLRSDISSAGNKTVDVTGEDFAGNLTTATCPYRVVDTHAPGVTGVPDRQPNVFGWYREPVTIDWQVVDESGQAGVPADTDRRPGRQGSPLHEPAELRPVRELRDRHADHIAGSRPANGHVPSLAGVPGRGSLIGLLSADVSDALSGSRKEATVGIDISSAGQKTAEITGDDFAGNSTTVTCPYIVVDNRAD